MVSFSEELRRAGLLLVQREPGPWSDEESEARVRRSISTSYYALFHFLTEEAGRFLIGMDDGLLRRRRLLARSFTHRGLRAALGKVRGPIIDASVAPFFAMSDKPPATPDFASQMANVFIDAQSRRHDADYDLNATLTVDDAFFINVRVRWARLRWLRASSPADQDFKHALCTLMLLRGQLRRDEP